VKVLDEPSERLGFHHGTVPAISEIDIDGPLCVVVATDGLTSAGSRRGSAFDVPGEVAEYCRTAPRDVGGLADRLVARAMALEGGRPSDDVSVLAVAVREIDASDGVRRLVMRLPLKP
jgi:serine phosphatase RsbU (regulator of sigma subunit)